MLADFIVLLAASMSSQQGTVELFELTQFKILSVENLFYQQLQLAVFPFHFVKQVRNKVL